MPFNHELTLHADPLRLDWTGHWLTPVEYARVMGRPAYVVWRWCRTGVLAGSNVPVAQYGGRYWIKLMPMFRP